MTITELTPDFYTCLVKNSSDLISTIDITGTYTYISDSVISILGYRPEEMVGSSALAYIHSEDLTIVQEGLLSIHNRKQIVLAPFRFRHKDGSWRWVECTATNMLDNPTVNGLVTNSRDITDKVLSDLKQQKNKAYYSALFYNHPDLVFTLNTSGKIDNANDGVFKLTGYCKEDLWDSSFSNFIKPDCLKHTQEAFAKALAGEAFTTETTIINAAGEELQLNITLVPVILNGEVKGVQCIAKDITDIKLANQKLSEHAAQLDNILDSITDPFIALDWQWRYSYANSKAACFLGCTQEELLGAVIWEKFSEIVDTTFYTRCVQVAETGVPAEFDEYFPNFNATLSFRIYQFNKGIAVQFQDNTAMKAAQAELKKLSLVASKTDNAVFITNSQHEIEWVNKAYILQTGYTLEEVMGKQPSAVMHGPDTNQLDGNLISARIAAGESISQEMLYYDKSGEPIWVTVDATPIYDAFGALENIIVIQTDITERKLAALKLEQLTDDLSKQNRDLQQFTYIVSHNLRAPVANVVGLTKLLQKSDLNSGHFNEALLNLDKSSHRLDNVIKDLNKILSLKTGDEGNRKEKIGIAEIIEEVACSLHTSIDQEQANIELEVGQHDILVGNRAYLYSIFQNLISNALKYRSPDRDPYIHIKSTLENGVLTVHVSDNGLGMNMKKVEPYIFTLYSRFHPHIEGKGFGLYLVKSQVEALDGTITVESEENKGTTFIIKFGK